tara:strand:- start:286 stop:609 length:324 start_codon:yes stop_codon:yes gene_type:complete
MKRTTIKLLNYLSLVLVVSFLFLHNIYLVLIGIFIALTMINTNYSTKFFKVENLEIVEKEIDIDREDKKESETKDLYSINYKLNLAQEIEELGYIPTINKNDRENVA